MGVHDLIVRNESNHDQRFQVHGWNNNQDIVVGPYSEQRIPAEDGSSGAIIAIHDDCIGEQAELTKCGFEGNDFIDLSNICGAGGNLIVMQVDDPSTAKGDPRFMQGLNDAWSQASQQTKDELRNCVTERDGRVVRIAAPKDFPRLEEFVRTFANGKTYIGIGAWNGHAGDPNDNNQSSAARGSKECLIIYNDDPIQIPGTAPSATTPPPTETPINIASASDPGPGIDLTNKSTRPTEYFFYDNYWNGNGTAGANFDKPLKSATLQPSQTQFIDLPLTFKGRVQRGTELPCTWVEFQLEAADDHRAHGDISLQQGCDGAATIAATDGTGVLNGFTHDVVSGAPEEAVRNKPSGERATDTTVGNWNGGPNQAAIEYLNRVVGQERAYILGGSGTPDVASANNRLAVVMY